jgi:hypothetical protein
MSLGMTIVLLIAGWLAVAAAMLWGVLRISRRHHHREISRVAPVQSKSQPTRPAPSH